MQPLTLIDGSMLEGGGQILRNATALAALTGRGITVNNIRAGRKNPGLSPQHLTGLQLVADITNGSLEGDAIRSTAISFTPGQPRPPLAGRFKADTKTAGSCTLLVQQALPVLLFAAAGTGPGDGSGSCQQHQDRPPKRPKADSGSTTSTSSSSSSSCLTLKGGTDASFAPPIGYLQHVFLPTLQRLLGPSLGSGLSLDLQRRGFYPKGGGVVQLTVPALPPGTPLPAWSLTDRGHLVRIRGWAVTAGSKLHSADVAQRMASSATAALRAVLGDPAVVFGARATPGAAGCSSELASLPSIVLDIVAQQEPPERAVGDGGSIVLVAETSTGCLLGASALAERGVSAEAVGAMAARDLLQELRSGAAVDSWLQDQLIIFMALASGTSSMLCSELSLHTRTAIAVAEQLLPPATAAAAGPRFSVCPLAAAAAPGSGGQEGGGLFRIKHRGGSFVVGTAASPFVTDNYHK